MKEILLISPPVNRADEKISIPLNLIILGSYLKNRDVKVKIMDLGLLVRRGEVSSDAGFYNETIRLIEKEGAKVIGITSMCSNLPIVIKLAEKIKRHIPESYVVLGGPEPSAIPEKILKQYDAIDNIVVGEGEISLCEIINALHENDDEKLMNISGTCVRCRQNFKSNPKRKLIDDLDFTDMPDYSLIPVEEYQQYGLTAMPVLAGSGCTFKCVFCSTTRVWEQKFRTKSASRLIMEMDQINTAYKITQFELVHDLFVLHRRKLIDFCSAIKGKNYSWGCSSRIDTINPDLIDMMKDSGCKAIFFGVESASEETQKFINKKIGFDKIHNILTKSIRSGIDTIASFIIGFPEETPDQINETLSYAIDTVIMGSDRTNTHLLSPLSNTGITQHYELEYHDTMLQDCDYLLLDDDETIDRIKKNPSLYPSFYRVKNNYVRSEELISIAKMIGFLLNNFTHTMYFIKERFNLSPFDFHNQCYQKFGAFEKQYIHKWIEYVVNDENILRRKSDQDYDFLMDIYKYDSDMNKIKKDTSTYATAEVIADDAPLQSLIKDKLEFRQQAILSKFNYDVLDFIRLSRNLGSISIKKSDSYLLMARTDKPVLYRLNSFQYGLLSHIMNEGSVDSYLVKSPNRRILRNADGSSTQYLLGLLNMIKTFYNRQILIRS